MGNRLRDATAPAVRGLPCLHRFVLITIATIAPDDTGAFYASVGTVARLCGTDAANVRRIIRRYEGRPNAVAGMGALQQGCDPGRFLYPVAAQAMPGQVEPNRYVFAVPAMGPATVRRKPRNPCGKTSMAKSIGRFREPTTPPPQGSVPGTYPLSPSHDGGSVPGTGGVGSGNLPTPVWGTDKLKKLNELKVGPMAPPSPPEESGTAGESPRLAPPPSRPGLIRVNGVWQPNEEARKGQQSNASEAEAVAG